jgi:tetratricopeptide (TPR) repeat protein
MNGAAVIIVVFFISACNSFGQNRTKETIKQTVDYVKPKVEPVREVNHTSPPIKENVQRDRPLNPPVREPIKNNNTPLTVTGRPIVPPSVSSTPPDNGGVMFVPLPYFTDPPVEDTYYPDPIENTMPVIIEHNYKELGLTQYKNGDYYEALESFQLALAKDSLDYLLYYYIGTTEIEIERYDDAVYDLTKFIDNIMENRLGFYQRGLANFYLGNRDAAFDDLVIADQYKVDQAKVILKRFYNYY